MDRENRKLQYRKLNEIEEGAELSEEDERKINRNMKKINEFIRYFKSLPEIYLNT